MEALAANQIAWLSGVSQLERGEEKSARYIAKGGKRMERKGRMERRERKGKGCTG